MAKYLTTIAAAGVLGLGAILACGEDPVEPKNQMPVAEASIDPMQGYSPLTVNFDGSASYDPDGAIVKYIWDFGDGVKDSTSGAMANHIYETPGSYTSGLTVADNSGGRNSKTLEDIKATQPPVNNPPQTSLDVSPTSGVVPLNVRVQYSCTDADPDDIAQSYVVVGRDTVTTTSIDSIFTFTEPGTYTTGAYCRDKAGAESTEGPIDTEATSPPQKSLSQTADLTNYVDINYTATLTNVSEATRNLYHNGDSINTKTITGPNYSETLTDRLKGNWRFIVTAPGAAPDTAEVDVPDYESEASDLSGVNLDGNERDSIEVHLQRATDKNKEQRPVKYTGVTATEGVGASIGAFPNDTILKIKFPEIAGPDPVPYLVHLAREGSPSIITLEGRVLDVPVPPAPPYLVKLTEISMAREGAIIRSSDGNLVMGWEQGRQRGESIFSYDLEGNLRWSTSLLDFGTVLDIVSDNEGVYFTGSVERNFPSGPTEALIGKVSNQGEILFLNGFLYEGGFPPKGRKIALKNDTLYVGTIQGGDIYLHKFDKDGTHLDNFLLCEGAINILGLDVGPDYILASCPSYSGTYLRKTTHEGILDWEKVISFPRGDYAPVVGQTTIEENLDGSIGSIYIGGHGRIFKLDSNGEEIWRYDWVDKGDNSYIMDLIRNPKGGIVAVGVVGEDPLYKPNDVGAVALDADGNLLWEFRLDQAYVEYFQSGLFTDENTLYLPMFLQGCYQEECIDNTTEFYKRAWLTKLITP